MAKVLERSLYRTRRTGTGWSTKTDRLRERRA
jgi:hypothetical protein